MIVYCTRNREVGHLPVGCLECNEKYPSLNALKTDYHAYYTKHYSFRCGILDCSVKVDPLELLAHFRNQHPNEQYRCAQCNSGFKSHNGLDQHGGETMHAAYRCLYPECGSECTRIADLKRHQLTHRSILQRHACPHCRKYRGDNGFKRMDHLRQHIRNYHHIDVDAQDVNADGSTGHSCPFEGCNKTGSNAFQTEKLLKVHLKKEHPSPFQCSYPGCDRVGTKGWFRERDMTTKNGSRRPLGHVMDFLSA
ncbi:hypothetical protein NA56DRAFT_153501 [Hyaloscypha hepaticicola]|uniref:C2H2-type domain-containing protein n=1 Tax=Hyaloscypha hepaticicola TaxID=2082293 RepID=A0A2J6QNZ6_9HELO|nr:hypothetical protein NA56DRAFT_153501 [Hyaloscypha hepaticicola]